MACFPILLSSPPSHPTWQQILPIVPEKYIPSQLFPTFTLLLSSSEHPPLFAWNTAIASKPVSLLPFLLPLPYTFLSLQSSHSEALKTKFRSCQFLAKTPSSFLLRWSPISWICCKMSYITQHLFISMNHLLSTTTFFWVFEMPGWLLSYDLCTCYSYYLECSYPQDLHMADSFIFFSGLSSSAISSAIPTLTLALSHIRLFYFLIALLDVSNGLFL